MIKQMALMDEFKEERENIKNGTLKQKAAYFWEYYKGYVIIPVLIIVAVSSYIYHIVTDPEDILNGILLNTHNMEAQEVADSLADEFCEEQEIDTKDYSITLNTSVSYTAGDTSGTANYETSQALMAWIAAGTVDFISGDSETMTELSYKGYLTDLREFLSEEEIAQYEPYFLYMDQAVYEARSKAFEDNQDGFTIQLPDCTKPEEMENPIPVLIDMSQSEKLCEIYTGEKSLILGIPSKAPHKDTLLDFFDYIME